MKSPWQKRSSRVVYKNPWFTIREDQVIKPDGQPGIYSVAEYPGAVLVVALTDQLEVCLINQYRYPVGKWLWELPCGGIGDEEALIAARRELQEETGQLADEWQHLGHFYSLKGSTDETVQVFLATNLSPAETNDMAVEGIRRMERVPLKQVWDMVKQGKLTDGQSIAALTMAALRLGLF